MALIQFLNVNLSFFEVPLHAQGIHRIYLRTVPTNTEVVFAVYD